MLWATSKVWGTGAAPKPLIMALRHCAWCSWGRFLVPREHRWALCLQYTHRGWTGDVAGPCLCTAFVCLCSCGTGLVWRCCALQDTKQVVRKEKKQCNKDEIQQTFGKPSGCPCAATFMFRKREFMEVKTSSTSSRCELCGTAEEDRGRPSLRDGINDFQPRDLSEAA